ncbi:SMI1/KNR4 family protein [Bacillus rugosus]|nr:SMI1/KNR4 family protein [Bacillus rugosus]
MSNLEKKLDVAFPNDYKAFLLQHNRMKMFDGIELLSKEEMIDHNEV